MAVRPVFLSDTYRDDFVLEKMVSFTWYPGFAKSQKQKSIKSLHEKFLEDNKDLRILDISSSSFEEVGVKLSAFNLMIKNIDKKDLFSVECLFQASKKFKNGGPYKDILHKSSLEAKKDSRLKTSGDLVSFVYKDEGWPLEPKTFFYDWIYINAVYQNENLAKELIKYDAFTDIEFNPAKSINCQARSAALYVSLYRKGLIDDIIASKQNYISIIKKGSIEQLNIFRNKYQ
ncbi:MAG: hypothetical protein E7211_16960 [Clostridium lundense]|nr:hypothetical protein [Clostridium lundense]